LGAVFLAGKFSSYKCEHCKDLEKNARGCDEETPLPLMEVPGYGLVKRCPVKLLTTEVRNLACMYWQYRTVSDGMSQSNGMLPNSGGVNDQSATWVNAMQILDANLNKLYSDAREAERRKHGR
jgi:hypothetical protein